MKSPEPEFLHSIATPLSTAMLVADTLKESLAERFELSAEEQKQFEGLVTLLSNLCNSIRQRQMEYTGYSSE